MDPRKSSNQLVALVFASLLLSAMAGGHRKKLLNKDDASEPMDTSDSMQQLQENDEVAVVVHERILRQVKMNDYRTYDPSPTMAKPHFKDIPN
ncbi:hypothetical protein U9M48_020289 [Paspalum notatum var. saurae]|uniref:Uncharacterized protein n=1 Tax=Paspalum notatum var. saurae TaxID=547442 RepID=A0AAQ3WRJ2_PASNO